MLSKALAMHTRVCRCCGASLPRSALVVRTVHHLCEPCSSLEDSEFCCEVPLAREVCPESTVLDSLAHRLRGTKGV